MTKKILAIALTVILALTALVGCSSTAKEIDNSQETTLAPADTNGFPITITHSYGETTIESVPKKAVIFDMGVLDIIDALAIEAEFAVPTASVPTYLAHYAGVVNAGGIKEPDFEAIMSFEPDIIFISGRQASFYEEFNKIAPTVYVELRPENYLEDFKNNVTNVGKIFGVGDLTDEVLAEIDNLINEAAATIEKSDAKALVVLTNDGNISAYGSGSRFGIVHDVLGAKPADKNIDASTHGQAVGYEYIAEVNPDILFVIDRSAVVGGSKGASDTLENELVQKTNAHVNNKIIYLDPEVWYLAGGGINSTKVMVNEVLSAY